MQARSLDDEEKKPEEEKTPVAESQLVPLQNGLTLQQEIAHWPLDIKILPKGWVPQKPSDVFIPDILKNLRKIHEILVPDTDTRSLSLVNKNFFYAFSPLGQAVSTIRNDNGSIAQRLKALDEHLDLYKNNLIQQFNARSVNLKNAMQGLEKGLRNQRTLNFVLFGFLSTTITSSYFFAQTELWKNALSEQMDNLFYPSYNMSCSDIPHELVYPNKQAECQLSSGYNATLLAFCMELCNEWHEPNSVFAAVVTSGLLLIALMFASGCYSLIRKEHLVEGSAYPLWEEREPKTLLSIREAQNPRDIYRITKAHIDGFPAKADRYQASLRAMIVRGSSFFNDQNAMKTQIITIYHSPGRGDMKQALLSTEQKGYGSDRLEVEEDAPRRRCGKCVIL